MDNLSVSIRTKYNREIKSPFDESILQLVRYECTCGKGQPLCRMYFCRYCLELRCCFCVSHELDSHYCPICLDNVPSAEARRKKNRCSNCFDCPSCGHGLSTRLRGAKIQPSSSGENAAPKKMYYLACAWCRWTSWDIGLSNRTAASGEWPEVENIYNNRIMDLLSYYRAIGEIEKIVRENLRSFSCKPSYLALSEKYGLLALARRRVGLLSSPYASDVPRQHPNIDRSETISVDEIESLPKQLFEEPVDLLKTTTLHQRLAQTAKQPTLCKDFQLLHTHLIIKRSQRCRVCEHILCKPEYTTTSIKFKIQLAAYYHVPEVTIYRWPQTPLISGKSATLVLKFVNPTQTSTHIQLMKLSMLNQVRKKPSIPFVDVDLIPKSLMRQPIIITASKRHKVISNAHLDGDPSQYQRVFIPARDDAAEFDENCPELDNVIDNPDLVAWRKANRVGLFVQIRLDENISVGEEIIVGLALKFVYTNTVSALEQKDVQTAEISVPIFVNVGRLSKQT